MVVGPPTLTTLTTRTRARASELDAKNIISAQGLADRRDLWSEQHACVSVGLGGFARFVALPRRQGGLKREKLLAAGVDGSVGRLSWCA